MLFYLLLQWDDVVFLFNDNGRLAYFVQNVLHISNCFKKRFLTLFLINTCNLYYTLVIFKEENFSRIIFKEILKEGLLSRDLAHNA